MQARLIFIFFLQVKEKKNCNWCGHMDFTLYFVCFKTASKNPDTVTFDGIRLVLCVTRARCSCVVAL